MNLIEQLGGYEAAKKQVSRLESKGSLVTAEGMKLELLDYRRQHNIFERNDYVVNKDIKYSDELNIVSASNDKALWFFGKIYGGFVKSQFRHATDAEIKAGKRLEVK
ncbi:MAG: hypothetical protein JKX96_01850 [Acinetobacter sp.]|nr:hypothetical protein [Acinetobacter sp.]